MAVVDPSQVPVERDRDGMWLHPSFPWSSLPEEGDARPCLASWGYQSCFVFLEQDAPPEIADRYFRSGVADCSDWTPTRPAGDGWLLGAIDDSWDGPVAVWMRPLRSEQDVAKPLWPLGGD